MQISDKQYSEVRALLVERFPNCFFPKNGPKRPLILGIHKTILARCPDIPRGRLKRFLEKYTRGATYLKALADGLPRVDLGGNTIIAPAPVHTEYARQRLARKIRKYGADSVVFGQ